MRRLATAALLTAFGCSSADAPTPALGCIQCSDSAAGPDTTADTGSSDTGPDDAAPETAAETAGETAAGDTAPAPDVAPDAPPSLEEGRCLAGAPRLEWRTAGCFDTVGVPSSAAGPLAPFYCAFHEVSVTTASEIRCVPVVAGKKFGHSDPSCASWYLDAVAWGPSSTPFTGVVSLSFPSSAPGGFTWEPHWASQNGQPAAGKWWDWDGVGACKTQPTLYPYANSEGKTLSLGGTIALTAFAKAAK